jgi:hypothetical protein
MNGRPRARSSALQAWILALVALLSDAREHLSTEEFAVLLDVMAVRVARETADHTWRRAA